MQSEDDLFKRALAAFGQKNRLNKFREECDEAAVAVDRFLNDREGSLVDLVDEIADVHITMNHAVKIMNELVGGDAIQEAIERKTKKLIGQIEDKEREIASSK